MDDYLDRALSTSETRRLELHVASCPPCGEELRRRLSLERTLQQALGASVQGWVLPPATSATIIRQAQDSLHGAIRSKRTTSILLALSAAAAIALVLIGLYYLGGHFSMPSDLRPVAFLPIKPLAPPQPPVSAQPARVPDPLEQAAASLSPGDQPVLSIIAERSYMEPLVMTPGQAFTINLALRNNASQPLDPVRFDLEISGPTGNYRFPLSLQGSLPVNGVSTIQITPDQLAAPCREKYLISPTQIFGLPGIYRLRFILYSPTPASSK